MNALRKLKRDVAHVKMKKAGYKKINKKKSIGSIFSNHWRDYY